MAPVEAQVGSDLLWGQGLWLQQSWVTRRVASATWRRSPVAPDDPQTAGQLYQRISHTVKKVLGSTTDFPTWGLGKGTESPREFDFGGQWETEPDLPVSVQEYLVEA